MREAIGGTWLFNLVIFFVLLFTGYMCLSINYTKAFNVKDKIINELERNGGVKNYSNAKDYALSNISEYMREVGYRTTGKCDDKVYDYGCNTDGTCLDINDNSRYAFCLKEVKANDTYAHANSEEFPYISYYKIQVFYQLDLPVIRQMFNFNIKGDTKLLYKVENKHED